MLTVNEFAKHLDLAYLAPNLQKKDIIEACDIAKKISCKCSKCEFLLG